ncbi:MAG: DUF2283 domain-containing protein [Desulfurococcales archaeon]|nr:DUF2283 domain-containing protein [Desulfurococcales archaeon]
MAEDRLREYEEAMEKVKELKLGDVTKMWIEYDKRNDILYIGFGREDAEESIMVDDDIVVGISGDRVIGITIFNFSRKVGMDLL